jgi:hypothetical protein
VKILLAKAVLLSGIGFVIGVKNEVAKTKQKEDTRQKKLETIIKRLPVDEGAVLVALARLPEAQLDLVIDSMPADMTQRLYNLTQCINMELENDFSS